MILASIPSVGDYSYTDWTSEEKAYTGYINPNDIRSPYIRNQKVRYTSGTESTHYISEGDTYESIAKSKGIDVFDLQKANNNKDLIPGETLIIPANFSLPAINPEAIFDNINPYIVEIIPYSVTKKDGKILEDKLITLGSDDEEPLTYTYTESEPITIELERGEVKNGRDALPYASVLSIYSIQDEAGNVYQPYSISSSGTETGDFQLKDNYIDWHTSHSLSKEPAAGVKYTVVLTYQTIDTIRIVMTSDYIEKSGYDKLWRSDDVKVLNGVCTPKKDTWIELPDQSEYKGYTDKLTDVNYVVEDNDLWVKTSVEKLDDRFYLKATMSNEDPKRNWYPEINTGYYYLQDKEYYMYSEPIQTRFADKEIPIIKNVTNSTNGIRLNLHSANQLLNSKLTIYDGSYEPII